jgi:hypothetical protein
MEELEIVIEMADYYRALPVISHAFSAALHRSKIFARRIMDSDKRDLLSFAKKIRSADLFRDCMILICGDMGDSKQGKLAHFEPNLGDAALNSLAIKLRNQIVDKIIETNRLLFDAQWSWLPPAEFEERRTDQAKLLSQINWSPYYYREMMVDRWLKKPGLQHPDITSVLELLENNITFNRVAYVNHRFRWEPDAFLSQHFLCANIQDSDLPVSLTNIFLSPQRKDRDLAEL